MFGNCVRPFICPTSSKLRNFQATCVAMKCQSDILTKYSEIKQEVSKNIIIQYGYTCCLATIVNRHTAKHLCTVVYLSIEVSPFNSLSFGGP